MKIISLPPDHKQSLELYGYLDAYSEEQGFNTRKPDAKPYLFVIKDENDTFLGGIQGSIRGDWLDIYSLYSTREIKGIGTVLLNHIENYAHEQKCKGIKLVTFEFQAPDFYLKHGYEIYGQVPDLINGYDSIFMKKVF